MPQRTLTPRDVPISEGDVLSDVAFHHMVRFIGGGNIETVRFEPYEKDARVRIPQMFWKRAAQVADWPYVSFKNGQPVEV